MGTCLNKLNILYGTRGTGVDISELACDRAIKNNPCKNLYYFADAENLPFEENTFNLIVSFDVIEHTFLTRNDLFLKSLEYLKIRVKARVMRQRYYQRQCLRR